MSDINLTSNLDVLIPRKKLDLAGALRRLKAINEWLDTPHPKGGVWLTYVDDAFMDAWDNADTFQLEVTAVETSEPQETSGKIVSSCLNCERCQTFHKFSGPTAFSLVGFRCWNCGHNNYLTRSAEKTTAPVIVGWAVGELLGTPAMYNINEFDRASDAARRWGKPITGLVQAPNTPTFAPRPYSSEETKASLTRNAIRSILLAHGFKIHEGQSDLKPYVYEAVESVLRASIARRSSSSKSYRENVWRTVTCVSALRRRLPSVISGAEPTSRCERGEPWVERPKSTGPNSAPSGTKSTRSVPKSH
jgi:hypothetical protein